MDDVQIYPVPTPILETEQLLYVTGEDAIQVTVFNAVAGVTVALSGRFLPARRRSDDPDAHVMPFLHTLTPATNRTASTRTQTLGEGWLIDGAVVVTAGAPLVGQTFAIVTLLRGISGGVQQLTTLGQGYITANQRLPISGFRFQSNIEGGGAIRSIVGTTPGAGAEISETVPTGARWQLVGLAVTLTTSVAATNRVVNFVLDDGVNVWSMEPQSNVQTASLTGTWSLNPGGAMVTSGGATRFSVPAPSLVVLPAGARIRTQTDNLQAADQYSSPKYVVLEWLEL